MVNSRHIGMAIFVLPFLFLCSSVYAEGKDEPARKHAFRVWVGPGIITPLDIAETNGSNLQRKHSWGAELGVGYTHKLYKDLSAGIAIGAHAYTFKYAADVAIDAPRIPYQQFSIRRTEKFYCFNLALYMSQRFILAKKAFSMEGGVRITQTPSLFLDHGQSIQDSIGATVRVFNSEVDFNNKIVGIYFLKFGTPLLTNTSRLSVHIVYSYCPVALGHGTFYFRNTKNNSDGTFNIKASGMGVEFRYSF